MQIVAKSDIGLVRQRNEDYFVVAEDQQLVVVCDGMGGHPGGDVASRMAAEAVQRAVGAGWPDKATSRIEPADAAPAVEPFLPLLHGVLQADRELRAYGDENPEYEGMGTTLVALQQHDNHVCIANVGDSRVYVMQGKKLQQVTQDHSVVATHPEYAHLAGMRNILTRAMGVGEELEVDFTLQPVREAATYLLCTDGLTNFVSEQRIAEVLAGGAEPEQQLDDLIEAAKSGGGGDNITLAIVAVEPQGEATPGPPRVGAARQFGREVRVQVEPAP